MKLSPRFKIIFSLCIFALYASGVLFYALDRFWKGAGPFGPENHAWQLPTLHFHAIIGLIFFTVFGYLYRAHIEPGLRDRKGRRRKSGLFLLGVIALLCLSVPALYYLSHEDLKAAIAWLHTYFGLLTPLLFFLHYL